MPYEHDDDDGLGSFDITQFGGRSGAFAGAKILKFNRPDTFITREGELIPPTRELLSLGLAKVVQKFVGRQLVDTIPIGPHDAFPDIDVMNAEAPRSEWGTGLNGEPKGPYTKLLILKLLDLET